MTDFRQHMVYIAYGIDDQVLYIGCTGYGDARIAQHRRLPADWWEQAVLIDRIDGLTKEAAFKIESDLIFHVQPKFNAPRIRKNYPRDTFTDVVAYIDSYRLDQLNRSCVAA